MIKTLLKVTGFIIIFFVLLSCLQPVYILKRNDGGVAFAHFYNEPRDTMDILMVGSSGMYGGILPAILWDEIGVTSYNLGMSYMNAAAQYFILKEALRYQSPSVVIIEGLLLFSDDDFDAEETSYRQALDHMRLSTVKFESIRDIVSNSEKQTYIDYLVPLLRYHDRRDIAQEDYDLSYKKQRTPYMGAWYFLQTTSKGQSRSETLIETDDIPTIYDEYFIKIIDMCKEKGIDVIIVQPPLCDERDLTVARYRALQDFADNQGVELINFNSPELYAEVNLDSSVDFFNDDHVNLIGADKTSRFVARYLQDTYGFENRKEAPYDPHWDAVMELHYERLDELREDIGND